MAGQLKIAGAVTDGSITESKLADDAVTEDKLDNSINTAIAANTAKVQTTINSNADNKVITGSDTANTLNGEANLTFDGSNLGINGDLVGSNNTTLYSSNGGSGVRAGIALSGSDQALKFYTVSGGSERMRIDSSGRVLIGTTTDNGFKFKISDSGGFEFAFAPNDSGVNNLVNYNRSGNAYVPFQVSGSDLRFGSGGNSERMRLDSSGRLLLGHSSARPVAGNTNRIVQIENGTSDIAGVSIVRNAASSGGPFISFGKSRSDSVGSNTIVQDGDTLGTISFAGADGTNLESRGADILGQVDGTPGENDMPGRLIFKTTADGSVSPTERMRIDSSGIITTTNSIHIPDNMIAGFGDTSSPDLRIYHGAGGQNNIRGNTAIPLAFWTNGSERMLIDSSGNIGIGNTNPSVAPNGISILPFVANDTSRITFNRSSSNYMQTVLEFQNGGGTVGTIKHNASSTQYNTSSDYRLKENATAISDGITRLKTLKPYRFNFKVDKDTTVDGFFAHEVTAVPEAITGTKDEVDSDNNPVYQGIDQSKLVPLLTAALQEEISKREALETRVAALEAA
tara:strand:- start:273 stop:1976 length:1704 start_codon:yes stop_codon:yes gene_type:complete